MLNSLILYMILDRCLESIDANVSESMRVPVIAPLSDVQVFRLNKVLRGFGFSPRAFGYSE